MKRSELASEAWRNIVSGTSRTISIAAVTTLLFGALIFADFATTSSILISAENFRAAGGNVAVMVANGRIDGLACASLADLPNVDAAGALRPAPKDLTPDTAPGTAVVTKQATPGLIALLSADDYSPAQGLYVSTDVSNGLGVATGDSVSIGGQPAHVGGVFSYPTDGRRSGLGYSIIEPVDETGQFDECWVQMWPQSDEVLSLMSTTVIDSGAGEPPTLAQLNPTLGAKFPGIDLYRDRITALNPLVAGAFGVFVAFGSLLLRRLEFASARHLGVRLAAQLQQVLLETSAWILTSIVLASALSVSLSTRLPAGDVWSYLAAALLTLSAGAVGAFAGTVGAMAWIDERHFLRYFRDR